MKTWGIALGAGGILGLAHIGVLEALESHGLTPNFLAGTSAGAIVAGVWASGKTPATLRDEARQLLFDEHVPWLQSGEYLVLNLSSAMAVSGLLDGRWLETIIDKLTGNKKLSDIPTHLSIVSCDLISGDTVVFTNTKSYDVSYKSRRYITNASLSVALRASSSLPGVFAPRKFGKHELVDGGVKDMVPAYEVRRMGAQEVLAVDLGTYADRPQKVKGILSVLTRSFSLSSRERTLKHLKKHASMTLRPEVWDIGFPTPSKIKELIDSGRNCAEENMERWLNLIS
ncbi:MAG TPA: hypothetical protein GX524_05435 [Firmicutes bacterium]|nr:hypothetical protein [Bacillota bacterium]